jgi:hypothetical protein
VARAARDVEIAAREAEHQLGRFVRSRGRNAPAALVDMEFVHNHVDLSACFCAVFSDRTRYSWRIDLQRLRDGFRGDLRAFTDFCRSTYSQLFEDHQFELGVDAARESFLRNSRGGDGLSRMHFEREIASLREAHRGRRREHFVFGVDPGHEIDLRPGAVNWVSNPSVETFMGRRFAARGNEVYFDELDTFSSTSIEAAPTTLTVGTIAAAVDQLRQLEIPREWLRVPDVDFASEMRRAFIEGSFFGGAFADLEAGRKGTKLLREWLSPDQRVQYDKHNYFEVVGGATGTRYRIRQGRQMNVHQLDDKSAEVCGLCFLPQGGLVAGDVMLAQKVALETNEREALRVANVFDDRRPRRASVDSSSWTGR